jgi:predicted Zn-dependent protease
MAFVYGELGWESEADAILRIAANGSSHPFTLIALADAETLRGNDDEAVEFLRRARRRYRNVPEVWEAMARLARHQGDISKADRHLAKADKLRRRQARRDSENSDWPDFTTNTMLPPR